MLRRNYKMWIYRINNIKIKASSLDGKQSWTTYPKQFEASVAASSWAEAEKAKALILALRGAMLCTFCIHRG